MTLLLRIALVSCSGAILASCGTEENQQPVELTVVQAFMQEAAALERGEALFLGSCAGLCHTLAPENTDAAFLFDCEWIHGSSDEEIFTTITVGIPETRMVGFGDNFPEGDDDKWKIIAYLRANQQPCE